MANELDVIRKNIEILARSAAKVNTDAQTVASNTVGGLLRRRIFNNGLATDGGSIGQYAPSTKASRAKAGRQTSKVDLEFSGTLRRSIQTGVSGKNVVLGIVETSEPKSGGFKTGENAASQEKHFGKDIFAPTEKEDLAGEKAYLKVLFKDFQKELNKK